MLSEANRKRSRAGSIAVAAAWVAVLAAAASIPLAWREATTLYGRNIQAVTGWSDGREPLGIGLIIAVAVLVLRRYLGTALSTVLAALALLLALAAAWLAIFGDVTIERIVGPGSYAAGTSAVAAAVALIAGSAASPTLCRQPQALETAERLAAQDSAER